MSYDRMERQGQWDCIATISGKVLRGVIFEEAECFGETDGSMTRSSKFSTPSFHHPPSLLRDFDTPTFFVSRLPLPLRVRVVIST